MPRKKIEEPKLNRTVRVSDSLWKRYIRACEDLGYNPNAYIRKRLKELVDRYEKNVRK